MALGLATAGQMVPALGQAGSLVTSAWLTGSVLSDSLISGVNVFATGSMLAGGRRLSTAGTGSPTTWGRLVQAGSAVTSAGSLVFVVYQTAFSAAPQTTASPHGTADARLTRVVGSDTAGSALFISHGAASVEFTWTAVGPA